MTREEKYESLSDILSKYEEFVKIAAERESHYRKTPPMLLPFRRGEFISVLSGEYLKWQAELLEINTRLTTAFMGLPDHEIDWRLKQ